MAVTPNRFAGSPVVPRFECLARLRVFMIRGLLFALLGLPGAVAADEYRLAPGDVLRVMIVGNPELTVEVPVEMDGSAWFPLVGPIAAGGATLRDVRGRTAEAYASMSLVRPIFPGSALPQMLVESQIHITVASYRPIYITGDVGPVHEVAFRTGMTLRHLLALASVAPPRDTSRQTTPGEIEAAATAIAHEYAQIWRQKSFLGIAAPEDYDRIFVTKGSAFDELIAVEKSILTEARADIEAQKQKHRAEISRIEARISVLSRQKDNETDGFRIDEQDLATVQDLFSRNLVPASRLTEVRRGTLVTASRLFQIEVALENARGQVATLQADILALDSDARVKAWKDLGEAVVRVHQRRSDLESLLASAGGNPLAGLLPAETRAIVTRNELTLAPAEVLPSLALMPGDVVEIRRLPFGSSAPAAEGEANQ